MLDSPVRARPQAAFVTRQFASDFRHRANSYPGFIVELRACGEIIEAQTRKILLDNAWRLSAP